MGLLVAMVVSAGLSDNLEEHRVESEGGFCLICRTSVRRVGIDEWTHVNDGSRQPHIVGQ